MIWTDENCGSKPDREIEALFSIDAAESIVDQLLALPDFVAGAAPQWDRALLGRLQIKLARQMKTVIDRSIIAKGDDEAA